MQQRWLLFGWLLLAAILCSAGGLLIWASPRFGYEFRVIQVPARELALLMAATGAAYMLLRPLIPASAALDSGTRRRLLAFVIVVGFLLRVALLWTEPALEDDYQRYLWDGAVTAHGLNPYALAPAAVKALGPESLYWQLVRQSGLVYERINHPELKTLYPPVAETAFALAHVLKPWSLVAWRLLCLAGECATLFLLLQLLATAGRAPLWCALYWWNPLVIKELINSAHMEAILIPLVLLAALFTVKGTYERAALALGVAIGAKFWPIVLVPLLFRNLAGDRRRLAICSAIVAGLTLLWLLPIVFVGMDQSSGLVVYAQRWRTNSALSPMIENIAAAALGRLGWPETATDLAARAALGLGLFAAIAALAAAPIRGAADLLRRLAFATGALVLFVPAQFPWYMTWMLIFAAFGPLWGFLATTAMTPLYYLSFHHQARGTYAVFAGEVVWWIWLPIWLLLACELAWQRTTWRRWTPATPNRDT